MIHHPMARTLLVLFLFVFLVLLTALSGSVAFAAKKMDAASIKFNVERYKLPNGLNVLLHVDKSAPLIAYYTWFNVGSKNEEPGYTGIAHLFEHMMFKGAKRYDGKAFDKVLGANGGTNNAFTTRDSTAYYAILPSSKLELIIDLESDRMENLQITQANLTSEREVVKEERRYRVDDSPLGAMHEGIFSTVFKVHPYRWPVIGWMEDLNRITVDKCKQFFKTYYAPNNATVVIAGDFNPADAKRLLEKYYGGIRSSKIPDVTFPEEPAQKGQREARVSKNVQNEHIAISFRTAPSTSDEVYTLDILSEILGGGEFSRLYKKLVYEKQIASQVGSDQNSMAGPGVFTIYISLKPGASHDDALQTTYSMLWDARNKLYTDRELEIAKNQVLRDHVEGLKTVAGKASALGYNEVVFGSYEHLFKDLEKYDGVTLDALRKVSAKYLNPDQRNLVVVNKFAAVPSDDKPATGEKTEEKAEEKTVEKQEEKKQ